MMFLKTRTSAKVIALTLVTAILLSMAPTGMAPVLAQTPEHAGVFTITVKNAKGAAISGAALTGTYGSIAVNGTTDDKGTLAVQSITEDIQANGKDRELILTVTASGYNETTAQSYGNYGATAGDEQAHVDVVMTGVAAVTPGASDGEPNAAATTPNNEGITSYALEQTGFGFAKTDPKQTYSPDFEFSNVAAGGLGNGTITYKIIDGTGKASIDSDTGVVSKVTKAGTVIVEATKAADGQVSEAKARYTLTIEKADQTGFGFEDPGPVHQPYARSFKYTNKAIGGQTDKSVTYTKADGGIGASVNSSTAVVTNVAQAGTLTVTATKPGNDLYNDATAQYELVIDLAEQTGFKFKNAEPGNIKYGMTYPNPASGGESAGAITYAVTANASIASVDAGGTVSMLQSPAEAIEFPVKITVSATKEGDLCYAAKTISYTLTIERDEVTTADFLVNGKAIKSPSEWYNAKDVASHGDKITIKPVNGYDRISEDGYNWNHQLEFSTEGIHSAKFYLRNSNNGATTSLLENTIKFDKTAPEHATIKVGTFNPWLDFWNTITFNRYAKDEQYFQITATDSVSQIAKIEYYEDNTGGEGVGYDYKQAANLPYSMYDDDNKPMISFNGLEKKTVVIYAKITDGAGNVSYFRTNGMMFDAVMEIADNPKINITLPGNPDGGPYYEDVPFRISVTDPNTGNLAHGIVSVVTTISAPGRPDKVITATKKSGQYPSEMVFDSSLLDSPASPYVNQGTYVVEQAFNSKNVTIHVAVKDVNHIDDDCIYEETVTLAVHTPPEITVSYDNNTFANGKYLGNGLNRKATIDITDLGYNPEEVILTVKKDGQDLKMSPVFYAVEGAADESGDQLGWRMILDYAQFGDGDYTFDIGYRNPKKDLIKKVDYVGVNPQEFTIDNTKPVIEVTYQNSAGPANTNYYSGSRTATIKVTERNWRSADFVLNLNAENNSGGSYAAINAPVLSSWTSNGDEHTATLSFQADGRYTFSAASADLANNHAHPFEEQTFYIDLTDPAVPKTLADINIDSFVNGPGSIVAPKFTVTDNNYDENNVEITLTGSMHGNAVLNGSWSQASDGRGGTYTFPNFENEKIKDDIYTLHVKVTDKSGRVSQSGPLEFSVNRFGSTFDMKGVQGINKGYYKTVQDIVIREINPNKIEPDAHSITLSRNGNIKELAPDNEYQRDAVEAAGKWSEYAYTVGSLNFKNDGKYVVTVKNKDIAKNENSSDNTEQTGDLVSFAIDNTPPTAAISGLEDNEIYSGQDQTITIALTDNIKLDHISIKLNGETVTGKVLEDIDSSYKTEVTIPGAFNRQTLELTYTDAAGNSNSTTVKEFLINANAFVRFYQNKPLFYGSIGAGAAVLLGFAVFLVLRKKKRTLAAVN